MTTTAPTVNVSELESEVKLLTGEVANISAACEKYISPELEVAERQPQSTRQVRSVGANLARALPKVLMICLVILIVTIPILAGVGGDAAKILAITRGVQVAIQALAIHENGTANTAAATS